MGNSGGDQDGGERATSFLPPPLPVPDSFKTEGETDGAGT